MTYSINRDSQDGAPDCVGSDDGVLWERCAEEPDRFFAGDALHLILEFVGDLHGKDTCVIGSGDNYAAFALPD